MRLKALVFSLLLLTSVSTRADNDDASQQPTSGLEGAVESARSTASELIVQAMGLLGVNYRYGGQSPDKGFDCSGFVSHVFKEAAGVILPHNAYQMSVVSRKIPAAQLQPGDLVFYNTLKRAFSHVGIYVGDDKFIHAPRKGKAVEIADMNDAYWTKRFQGARRVSQLAEQSPAPASNAAAETSKADLSTQLY